MARKIGPVKKGRKTPKARKAKAAVKEATAKPKARTASTSRVENAPPPAEPKSAPALQSFIQNIKASSLHDDDLAAVLSHISSVSDLRSAVAAPTAALKKLMSSKCYLKSGEGTTVSIYEGPYHVGSMSEAEAIALGIPSCG